MFDKYQGKASNYDKNALWQKQIAQELVNFSIKDLLYNENVNNIIDIGCGTGFIEEFLLQNKKFSTSNIIMLDSSLNMINQSKKKFMSYQNIYPICTKFEDFYEKNYDILFSNLAIHWFDNIINSILKCIEISKINYVSILLDSSMNEVKKLYYQENLKENTIKLPNYSDIIHLLHELNIKYTILNKKSIYQKMKFYDFLKEQKINGTIINNNINTHNIIVEYIKFIKKNKNYILNINYDILFLKLWK